MKKYINIPLVLSIILLINGGIALHSYFTTGCTVGFRSYYVSCGIEAIIIPIAFLSGGISIFIISILSTRAKQRKEDEDLKVKPLGKF